MTHVINPYNLDLAFFWAHCHAPNTIYHYYTEDLGHLYRVCTHVYHHYTHFLCVQNEIQCVHSLVLKEFFELFTESGQLFTHVPVFLLS